MQEKLMPVMCEYAKVIKNTQVLIQAARALDIPILYSEQVPEKIGPTIPEIHQYLKDQLPISKKTFSCCREITFLNALNEMHRKQIIVVGIEAHVCVYQTVADLIHSEFEVNVIADAVSSRSQDNKQIALNRAAKLGAAVSSTEMMVLELVGTAEHKNFKEILELIK